MDGILCAGLAMDEATRSLPASLPGGGGVIDAWEQATLRHDIPQVEIPLRHFFSDGLYAREIVIPKDCLITGRVHRQGHFCVVSKGRVRIFDDGSKAYRDVSAPDIFTSDPGAHRMFLALEETVFTTFHATKIRDVEQLERKLVFPCAAKNELDRRKALKGENAPCLS